MCRYDEGQANEVLVPGEGGATDPGPGGNRNIFTTYQMINIIKNLYIFLICGHYINERCGNISKGYWLRIIDCG